MFRSKSIKETSKLLATYSVLNNEYQIFRKNSVVSDWKIFSKIMRKCFFFFFTKKIYIIIAIQALASCDVIRRKARHDGETREGNNFKIKK